MNEWSAFWPIVGVVIGAVSQHWRTRAADMSKQVSLLRSSAYVDYLRAIAQLAHAPTSEARITAQIAAADAKARIAIYGTRSVVDALARFEEVGAVLDNRESIEHFVRFARAASLSGANPADLKLVLFGRE